DIMNVQTVSRYFFPSLTALLLLLTLVVTDATAQDRRIHVVKQGETLFSISKMYEVTIDQIRTWNNLTGNQISIGQRLNVSPGNGQSNQPSTPQTEDTPTPEVESEEPGTSDTELIRHQVRAGE